MRNGGSGARLFFALKNAKKAWILLPFYFFSKSQERGKSSHTRTHNERRDGQHARLSRVKKEKEEEGTSSSSVRLYPCRVHGLVAL